MKKNLSIIIFTHNDEKNIKDCIESVKQLSNNIFVIDIESSDKTRIIVQQQNVILKKVGFTNYVEPVREVGINFADTEWVLVIDADERIIKNSVSEIQKAIDNKKFTHYFIPRKNIFENTKWLRYGGWWPDYQIRLINKKYLIKWPKEIHSTPQINGNSGKLVNPLIHSFHGNIKKMVDKTLVFEDIESELLYKADKNASTLIFFRKFLGELFRRLFKNLGFLDGPVGIIECIYQAFSKTITFLFLYEKKNHRTLRPIS